MQNYNVTSEDLVRDLINSQQLLPHQATSKNLIFGKPSELLDDVRGDTQVNIRGVQDSEFANLTTKVYYSRIDLGTLFSGDYQPTVNGLSQTSLYRLLPIINQSLGIHFTERDLEDIDITTMGEGQELTLELRAKPGSLAYKGFTTLAFKRDLVYLSDKVIDDTVTELSHPDPIVEGSVSAGLLTWGRDFSEIQHLLSVGNIEPWDRPGFTRLAELQEALRDIFGLGSWPGTDTNEGGTDTVSMHRTTEVPEANTDFEKVVIQRDIDSNGYVGTAYFHFTPR